jgi:hypothetical protein
MTNDGLGGVVGEKYGVRKNMGGGTWRWRIISRGAQQGLSGWEGWQDKSGTTSRLQEGNSSVSGVNAHCNRSHTMRAGFGRRTQAMGWTRPRWRPPRGRGPSEREG